jgi:ABC-2 type transport system ATP-binding protein
MLTTTIRPTRGTATLGGIEVTADPVAARRLSAVVFQDPVVDRALTGRRNLQVHARLWGLGRAGTERRVADVISGFDLGGLVDRPVRTLSGGQRRRLEIARALLSEPSVLFLDEPTVGLDPRIRYELLDVIAGLRSRGEMTIVMTTHYLDEAERLCDRVAIVHRGRVVGLGTPAELLGRLGQEVVEVRLEGDVDSAIGVLRAQGVVGDGAFAVGATLTIPVRGTTAADVVDRIRELGVFTSSVATRMPTLDDVYLQLTGEGFATASLAA